MGVSTISVGRVQGRDFTSQDEWLSSANKMSRSCLSPFYFAELIEGGTEAAGSISFPLLSARSCIEELKQ